MDKILIDTNIYSKLLYGNKDIQKKLGESLLIGISVITIGELLAGFEAGCRKDKNQKQLKRFLDSPRVKLFRADEYTCVFYANIFNSLKKAGKPIPTNDMWIAAIAFQQGLPVYTSDKHFLNIDGLPCFLN